MSRTPFYPTLALLVLVAGCATPPAQGPLDTTDHLVPHVSTLPANAGQKVGLFVRQRCVHFSGVGNRLDREALFAEIALQELAHAQIVVDHEYFSARCRHHPAFI